MEPEEDAGIKFIAGRATTQVAPETSGLGI